jgi:hypothetical protein
MHIVNLFHKRKTDNDFVFRKRYRFAKVKKVKINMEIAVPKIQSTWHFEMIA